MKANLHDYHASESWQSFFQKSISRILVITSLCLFAFTSAYAEMDDSGDEGKQIYQIRPGIYLATKVKFQYGKPKIVIKATFPELQVENDMDEEVVSDFDQQTLDLISEEAIRFRKQVQSLASAQDNIPDARIKNNLTIDYATSALKIDKNYLVSVRFSVQGVIAGMAHPYHYHRVLNYNLNENKKIELSDLFLPDANYLSVISDYSKKVLSKRLDNKELVETGTEPKPENFANWNIKPNGLLFTFDEAQVAPSVNGAQTVLVPYSVLNKMISPDSPLAYCIKHKKRCGNNNILTGGFIDEATNTKASFKTMLSKR